MKADLSWLEYCKLQQMRTSGKLLRFLASVISWCEELLYEIKVRRFSYARAIVLTQMQMERERKAAKDKNP